MENLVQIILNLALFGAMICMHFTIKNLLPSYFKEKGKNIATKEDIAEITTLVEKAKHGFTLETEKLKASLILMTNFQTGIIFEERNAIIELNEKYFRWLNYHIDIGLNGTNNDNNDELEKYNQKIQQSYNDFLMSEAKFSLFVENKELHDELNEMKIETLNQFAENTPIYIQNLIYNNKLVEQLKTIPIEEQGKKHSELLDKRKEYMNNFGKGIKEGYAIIAPINRNFQKLCRKYIYELINQK